ncbi:hypothetical protein EG68_04073 [Paragonimus skrjabini miyazakii]|uniref:Uncharacterized protein n=1 Tax=Paragonimus skrjabini miyazakii TaxID=59628 RepID=A0A8S9Z1D3_9TREM|nr:hypothetical protein EG68_04073 [Paragonimus skrjabini miyazakii]
MLRALTIVLFGLAVLLGERMDVKLLEENVRATRDKVNQARTKVEGYVHSKNFIHFYNSLDLNYASLVADKSFSILVSTHSLQIWRLLCNTQVAGA